MVNYACAFSQSEFEKYFEWIIIYFKKLHLLMNKIARLELIGEWSSLILSKSVSNL